MPEFMNRDWKQLKYLDKELGHKHPILLGVFMDYQEVDCPDLSYLDTTVIDGCIQSHKYTQKEYDKNGHEWLTERIREDQEEKNSYRVTWCFSNVYAVAHVAVPGRQDDEFHTIAIRTQGTANVDSTTIAEARAGNTCYSSVIEAIEDKEMQELKHMLGMLGVRGMDIIGGHLSVIEGGEHFD